MAIDFNKFLPIKEKTTKIDFNKFLPEKKEYQVKTLPDFLGGGAYNQVVGNVNDLYKTERGYAGVETEEKKERHHIIPVEFGGSSETDRNILALPIDAHERITEAEKQISKDYQQNSISLGEARTKMMGLLQKELDKAEGVERGTKTNLLGNLKNFIFNPIETIKESFKAGPINSIKKIIEANPNTAKTITDIVTPYKATPNTAQDASSVFFNAIKEQIDNNAQQVADLVTSNYKGSKKVGKTLETAVGTAGVLFSPITALFESAKTVPLVSTLASLIELPLSMAGDTANNIAEETINALPIDSEVKENLRQGIKDVSILASQLVVAGKLNETLKTEQKIKLKEKYGEKDAKTIEDLAIKKAKAEIKYTEKPKIDFNKYIEKPKVSEKVTSAIEEYVFYNNRKSLTSDVIKKIDDLNIKPKKEITLYRDGRVDSTKAQSWSKDPNIGKNPTKKTFNIDDILIDFTDARAKNLFTDVGKESLAKYKKLENEVLVKPIKPPYEPKTRIKGVESGLSKQIESKAVELGLRKKGFNNLAEYDASTIKEQAQVAKRYKESSIIDIATGKRELPKNMKPGTALSIAEDIAVKKKDVRLLRDLANSPLVTRISESASELSLSRMRENTSVVRAIEEVIRGKEKYWEERKKKNIKKAKNEEVKKMKEEIKKEKITKNEWQSFIEEIKC